MTKRRTKKQKEKAKHQFLLNWKPEAKIVTSEPVVKGQFKKAPRHKSPKLGKTKKALLSAKDRNLASIRKDIFKSIIIASLILSLELVIYLFGQG
jgi:hypothetical protein